MTIAKHATRNSHRRSARRIVRRDIREQLADCKCSGTVKGVKK